jgi:hypothetical protein
LPNSQLIAKKSALPESRRYSSVRTLARPDEWALDMELRVDGHPFTLTGREYIRQVIRDTSDEIVIPKAAQTAFTVTFLCRSFHWVKERGWHCLYLLPLKTGAIPFVQARIDPMILSNPELSSKFKTVDNRLHKQTVDGINFYIRGTNIDRELQEIPVDFEVWDERDRMVEDNLEDARARMDGSDIKKLTILSTPTVPGHGVDAEDAWWASDQHRWEISCPGCGRYQVLNFEENLRLGDKADECVLECTHCHRAFQDGERASLNATGRWVPYNPDGIKRGYHISQFNSRAQPLVNIMRSWFAGQSNARKLRSFFNNSLGIPYVAPGDQLTPEILDKCIVPGHIFGGIPDSAIYIGVDVGTMIHVTCYTLNRHRQFQLWQMKIFREWGELDKFLGGLANFMCVCDAHPEKRAARDLALKYVGRFWLGFELDRPQTQEIAVWHPFKHKEAGKVVIDRTMAFDTVIKDFMDGNVILPSNARELGELVQRDYNGYYAQMIQMVRVEEEDTQGRIVARWKKNRNPDHWHHSAMFARIATFRQPSLVVPQSISEAFQEAGSIIAA